MSQTDELKALRAAKAAAGAVTSFEQTLRARHTALVKERRTIAGAFRALDELLADKDRLIDEAAARWDKRCSMQVVMGINGGREKYAGRTAERKIAPALPSNRGDVPDAVGLEELCALVPGLLKARLADVITASGAQFGLPAEARTARLAELDAQIAEIEAQHVELVDGAAEVGVILPLLDAVKERREAEALRKKREDDLAAERAKGIFSVSGPAVGGRG